SQHFCDTCNRVRLTSWGDLVLCLGREDRVNLRDALRSGADDASMQVLILQAVRRKPLGHGFQNHQAGDDAHPHAMATLGG
ncbi:MAG: GTP 3',8-cyclase MoaA, partial [Magnetococcales bacterium]|nr:GTP 3',8-cyclase MoaA [Magnetococcales bacterium]